jgi:hypothetical protein
MINLLKNILIRLKKLLEFLKLAISYQITTNNSITKLT